ncbi:hypothetical protein N0V94_008066 [Neodidymelliopsis sp. IMI 364377]|nr:hypothetical protein N0V94_008066 [Neodidymelliopsis sp. IMI 364377]
MSELMVFDEPNEGSLYSNPPETATGSTTYPQVITLNVGGRKFMVSTDTLIAESGLFRHQLSDRFAWTPQPDGSYFLDADPDLFDHLLRFMRRPSIFPLFYSKAEGFDYDLYHRLEVEAEYFQMHTLHAWLEARSYENAVHVRTRCSEVHDVNSVPEEDKSVNSASDWQIIPLVKTRSVYVCPRNIHCHRGNSERCGHACSRTQGSEPSKYENECYVEAFSVKKEIVFDQKACEMA